MALSVHVHHVEVKMCGGDRKKRSCSESRRVHFGGVISSKNCSVVLETVQYNRLIILKRCSLNRGFTVLLYQHEHWTHCQSEVNR